MDASSAAAGKRTQAPPATLLEVRDLRTVFRTEDGDVPAVDGVSFTLARGRTLGIVGESGCGKSTLARCLAGLQPISAGQLRFNGRELGSIAGRDRQEFHRNVQMIFQDPVGSLNPRMSAGQAIGEVLAVHGRADGRIRERTAELLQLVG